MITRHQYLEKYPINSVSEKLIVGTIHPHSHEKFQLPFFYGNKNSLWRILNEAFPHELSETDNLDLAGILNFLSKYKISVSDTICECERITNSALDKDLMPTHLNHSIIEDIRQSKITKILFTSGFGKNNAFKLFYENILGLKVTPEIKANREIELDKNIFGRSIKLSVLYSPSGAANTGLVKSKTYLANKEKYVNSKKPVHDFKVDYYRQKFCL